MKITLIYPSMGKTLEGGYIKSWLMEPLSMAVLSGVTPKDIELRFYDDRLEEIPYEEETDLVGISVETYTARRSYEIANKYRKRNVAVVMGGYHATLCTEEVIKNCDAVVVGEGEDAWLKLINDFRLGKMKRQYSANKHDLSGIYPDRSIFSGKNYFDLALVETGRGCKYTCEFCSITNFFKGTYRRRPIEDIIKEIKAIGKKYYFFVDDNITSDFRSAKLLFSALKSLSVKWVSQASIDIAKDIELLDLMRDSGCLGLLIGFESLSRDNLNKMKKRQNTAVESYESSLDKIRQRGIVVYGTFVVGYDEDDKKTIEKTIDFGIKNKLFLIAFNHLTPFPGTPVYDRFKEEGKMFYEHWWLHPNYRFGEVPFKPEKMAPDELKQYCLRAKKRFFGFSSIMKRGFDFRANCKNINMAKTFFAVNILLGKEVEQKNNIVLGVKPR